MSAAALYLCLRALGLKLTLVERPDRPEGLAINVTGPPDMDFATKEGCKELLRKRRAILIAFMRSGSPDAVAVRQEGRSYGSPKKDRKEAA